METTVTLQPPFEYEIWVLVVFSILLVAGIAGVIFAIIKMKNKETVREVTTEEKTAYKKAGQITLYNAKRKYVLQTQRLIADYKAKKISKRDGYQKLSLIIRGFVFETTKIDVTKYTLRDLKELKLSKLDTLIEEYYVLEFGEDERSKNMNLEASCNRAMGVIKTWN